MVVLHRSRAGAHLMVVSPERRRRRRVSSHLAHTDARWSAWPTADIECAVAALAMGAAASHPLRTRYQVPSAHADDDERARGAGTLSARVIVVQLI